MRKLKCSFNSLTKDYQVAWGERNPAPYGKSAVGPLAGNQILSTLLLTLRDKARWYMVFILTALTFGSTNQNVQKKIIANQLQHRYPHYGQVWKRSEFSVVGVTLLTVPIFQSSLWS